MKLTWHGQACFTIEAGGCTVAVDPYADGMFEGHAPLCLTADAVFCSHEHHDHNARDKVTLTGKECAFSVQEIHTYHDDEKGAKRGANTIRIFSADGLRVAHLGDLGCELEPEQKSMLRGLDAILVPVGGFFTIDAKQAKALMDELRPRVVIPMHYRVGDKGLAVLSTVDEYVSLCDDAVIYDSDTFELTADTPSQTAVLKFD